MHWMAWFVWKKSSFNKRAKKAHITQLEIYQQTDRPEQKKAKDASTCFL